MEGFHPKTRSGRGECESLALASMANPASDPAALAAFLERNSVDALPVGRLEQRFAAAVREGRPLRAKLGIDPTAPDIHLGHVVVLQKLREFQDAGATVVLIIGDFTARIGDPSGRSKERPVLPPEQIDANAKTFQEQAFKVLDPGRIEVRHNSEWLDMDMASLLALLRVVTVARVLERDDFQNRIVESKPISMLELLYPVMQGYDSVAIESDVELGGTDQKFNLLLGRDVQTSYDQEPQAILTMPILPGTDGVQRMSKSLGNYIGVTEPAEEMFGKLMSIPDSVMDTYYELLLGEERDKSAPPVEAKRELGRRIVERFHPGEGQNAEAHFDRLHKDREQPDEIEEVTIAADGQIHMPALLADHFGVSRSEARRLLGQGGVKIEGQAVADLDVAAEKIDGAVVQVGKRKFRRIKLVA